MIIKSVKNLEKLFPETAIKIENSVNNNIGESLKIGEYLGDDYNDPSSPYHSGTTRTHGSRPWRGEASAEETWRSDPIKIRNTNRLNSTHAVSQRDRTSTAPAREYQPSPICYRAECARKRCRKRALNERRNTTGAGSRSCVPIHTGMAFARSSSSIDPSFALLRRGEIVSGRELRLGIIILEFLRFYRWTPIYRVV